MKLIINFFNNGSMKKLTRIISQSSLNETLTKTMVDLESQSLFHQQFTGTKPTHLAVHHIQEAEIRWPPRNSEPFQLASVSKLGENHLTLVVFKRTSIEKIHRLCVSIAKIVDFCGVLKRLHPKSQWHRRLGPGTMWSSQNWRARLAGHLKNLVFIQWKIYWMEGSCQKITTPWKGMDGKRQKVHQNLW